MTAVNSFAHVPHPSPARESAPRIVEHLHLMAARALPRMYVPDEHAFVFTEHQSASGLEVTGRSVRYSAIALIGLEATSRAMAPFDPSERQAVARALLAGVGMAGLGDAALIAWAATAARVNAAKAWSRIEALTPTHTPQPTVELAWALAAMSLAAPRALADLRRRVALRLMSAYSDTAHVFPHFIGESHVRSHVTCFADQVYPIHALSEYADSTGDTRALTIASECAQRICALQGPAGQWWWHYDARTGTVLEEYPVYAIHQDAMGPMALFALSRAGGPHYHEAVTRGVEWLASAPELDGGTLIDDVHVTLWRKVARREPGKTSRYIQAAASRWRGGSRLPGLGALFPPGVIDREDRPYHWGWFLYAWANRQNDEKA